MRFANATKMKRRGMRNLVDFILPLYSIVWIVNDHVVVTTDNEFDT